MQNISPQHLLSHLRDNQQPPLLLDVREPWEFETCHISGSTLIPMRDIPQAAEDLDKNRETIVICHHGIRSRHVAYYLEQNGFTNVINLEGGVERWAVEVEPSMKRY